jgi:glycerol-3-phosphate acyltransferase PlsY
MELLYSLLAIVAAYLVGSLSFAVIVSKPDGAWPIPRSYGSKNPGATNVLRSGNRVAAVLTLAAGRAEGLRAGAGGGLVPRYAFELGFEDR